MMSYGAAAGSGYGSCFFSSRRRQTRYWRDWSSDVCSSDLIDRDEVKKTKELAYGFKTYEELKAKNGVMDFSDMTANTLRLFRTRKKILASYQERSEERRVGKERSSRWSPNH